MKRAQEMPTGPISFHLLPHGSVVLEKSTCVLPGFALHALFPQRDLKVGLPLLTVPRSEKKVTAGDI